MYNDFEEWYKKHKRVAVEKVGPWRAEYLWGDEMREMVSKYFPGEIEKVENRIYYVEDVREWIERYGNV